MMCVVSDQTIVNTVVLGLSLLLSKQSYLKPQLLKYMRSRISNVYTLNTLNVLSMDGLSYNSQ